ncbi:endolytic transglycosylase MltG [Thorsellia anophelis]|uniref:Endolytic murein transglycosylase n=1 Tax=Thorsellia anophelis DSM 18579 TaxID=1123402 RepID=A0A1I0B362_9GAMM|nr:endolytic transglycosylase MltG [Thorsellia anophelis]SET00523.1 UPF0755 protein [Thorsellia anophelis DSM 18579]
MVKRFLIICFFALLALLACLNMAYQKVIALGKAPILITEELILEIKPGTGRQALESLLVEQNIIAPESAKWFQWLLRLEPELAKTKAGTYRIAPNLTTRALLEQFVAGKEAQFSIRFTEGTRLSDALETLSKAPHIKHTLTDYSYENIRKVLDLPESTFPEGWIYPDTYLYTANTSDVDILKRSHANLNAALDSAWANKAPNLPYKSKEEMLIMASIIEKETAIASERETVSSVFVNRLNKNMRLQTDPTVIYGMGSAYNGNITKKDLQTPTAYNTYTIDGLPPSAISLVGKASIEAAAHPAQTNYLYFVADGKGGHTFNENLKGHNNAVQKYIKGLKDK